MSSIPQLPMLKITLTAQLDYIFSTFGEKMFIKESEIIDAYYSETKEHLEEKLRLLNVSLNEFIKQCFYGRFNFIEDPQNSANSAYMCLSVYRSHISQPTPALPSAGQQQHDNGFAPTPPPATNGIGFSATSSFNSAQSFRPSHTPTPPPVVPTGLQTSNAPPPGFYSTGLQTSNAPPPGFYPNDAKLTDQRAQMLQKQFSDRGFESSDNAKVEESVEKKVDSPVVEMPESTDEDDRYDEFPPLSGLKSDVEFIAKQFAKTQQASQPASKSTKRAQEYSIPLSELGFQPDLGKLFYTIAQSSIINSPQVNIYRETYYEQLASTSGLYAGVSEDFKWLTGTHLHLNPNAEGYLPYNSFVIDVLQTYNEFYRDGMDAKVLLELEKKLCSNTQRVCLGKSTEIMSIAEIVAKKMIIVKKGRFFVHPEIAKIKLWKLPAGLTSNLYRLLNAQQETLVQDVSTYTGILTDMYNDPITVADEDIVHQTNIFPLVFKICAEATEQNSVRIGKISLHEKLPRWKVLLDQPSYFDTPFHCDCCDCVPPNVHPPIIVPEHD